MEAPSLVAFNRTVLGELPLVVKYYEQRRLPGIVQTSADGGERSTHYPESVHSVWNGSLADSESD